MGQAVKKKHYIGIRAKIVTYTVLCVVAVGLISNLFLYQYMQKIITEKVSSIDSLYAQTIAAQLNYGLERVLTLEAYCVNSVDVAQVLRYGSLEGRQARNYALTAQNTMNAYLRTSPIDSYINKLFIFNDSGVIVHALSTYSGTVADLPRLLASEQYARWKTGELQPFDEVYRSLNPGVPNCFALIAPVYPMNYYSPMGYVYIEVDARLVTDILAPYNQNQINRFFVHTEQGNRLMPANDSAFLAALEEQGDVPAQEFAYAGIRYMIQSYPLELETLTLRSCINQTALQASNHDMMFSIVMVSVMIVTIATAILVALTHYVTVPINRIMEKINKIALNDYSFDPELERPSNELGEVGARLNELGVATQKLLDETIALHDERAEIEMALLQSQVNPHFLYNTLNSIHWMAVMQKNPGIEKTVKSLVNLLKNVSKGVSDRISLAEELALLDDYVSIQSVRYMGAFDYICNVPDELKKYKIIKFTLQPLVENAMFHGVVPKGTFGTITVDAREERDFLVIAVHDDGVGMPKEEAMKLLRMEERPGKTSMSGIGVANVHRRLRLAYGREYGLSVESEQGVYTCISVRVPKEL